jgi:RimJ/RimL family protein N-acetyltransferase
MIFDLQPHLEGDLITMRPMAADDFEPLFAVASDPLVWEMHPFNDRYKEPVFRAFFEDGLASGGALVAIDRESSAMAGSSRFSAVNAGAGEIEIGWTFLGRRFWGGPHNLDMKRIMLSHAFRFVDPVIFRIGETNLRSRRAIEKMGATLTDRPDPGAAAAPVKHLIYAIKRSEFEERASSKSLLP